MPASNNLDDLEKAARNLEFLLEEYAKRDNDVLDFLERIRPWFLKIRKGEISLPCNEYNLYQYFANSDLSPLTERYQHHELGRAEAIFSCIIRGW